MRDLPRCLKAEAEALGLHNVRFDWNHPRPYILGEFAGITVVQSFSFSRDDWHHAHRNAIASLRRKMRTHAHPPQSKKGVSI